MIIAVAVVPSDGVLVGWRLPQIQVAVGSVVTIRLIVPGRSQPPWRSISSLPGGLSSVARVHGVASATTAAILRPGDVNDPVRSTQRLCGGNESLPILSAGWCEELCARWARVLVIGPVNVEAVLALQQNASSVLASELDLGARAARWAACLWSGADLHALAII
jgi:hypothetical protein